jgi:hypothetical protein
MGDAADPYLPVEDPVLHGVTSFSFVPAGVIRISNSLKGGISVCSALTPGLVPVKVCAA